MTMAMHVMSRPARFYEREIVLRRYDSQCKTVIGPCISGYDGVTISVFDSDGSLAGELSFDRDEILHVAYAILDNYNPSASTYNTLLDTLENEEKEPD